MGFIDSSTRGMPGSIEVPIIETPQEAGLDAAYTPSNREEQQIDNHTKPNIQTSTIDGANLSERQEKILDYCCLIGSATLAAVTEIKLPESRPFGAIAVLSISFVSSKLFIHGLKSSLRENKTDN